MTFPEFSPADRGVFESERGATSPARVMARLRNDLLRARDLETNDLLHEISEEGAAVARLRSRWRALTDAAFPDAHRYEALLSELGDQRFSDPAELDIHLLGASEQP